MNDRESGELLRDAYQLTIDGIAGFMYPKATKRGMTFIFLVNYLKRLNMKKGFLLEHLK